MGVPTEQSFIESQTFSEDWSGTTISGVDFRDVIFEGCIFAQTKLFRCCFENCTFKCCELSGASIEGSGFLRSRFHDCSLKGIFWGDVGLMFGENLFERCLMDYGTLVGAKLSDDNSFAGCSFREFSFENSSLQNVVFDECNFAGARFLDCDLRKSDFSSSRNYEFDFTVNKTNGMKVSFPEASALLKLYGIRVV